MAAPAPALSVDASGSLIVPQEIAACQCWSAGTQAHGSAVWSKDDVTGLIAQLCADCKGKLQIA